MNNKNMNNQDNQNKTSAQKWIERYKAQLKKDNEYFSIKDWRTQDDIYLAYKVHLNVTKRWLSRLKQFRKEFEPVLGTQYAKTFQEKLAKPIDVFGDRCRAYSDNPVNDILSIDDPDRQLAEVEFQTQIGQDLGRIDDTLSLLQLDEETNKLDIPIRDGKKISVAMSRVMEDEDKFPELIGIRKEVISRLTKKDLETLASYHPFHIYNKDAPVYDSNLHYFEQEPLTLKYYENEFEKIRNGVTVDGVFITGWLYWQVNFFKNDLPMGVFEGTDKFDPAEKVRVDSPPLSDNELYFNDYYEKHITEKRGAIFGFGTRRFGKTVLQASMLHYTALTSRGSECLVVGGSADDLDKLVKTIKISLLNINPAFSLEMNQQDWIKGVNIGLKSKSHKEYAYSTIFIRNVNDRKKGGKQAVAGVTPNIWICDEIGKFDIIKMWNAALPSFQTPFGWNCLPLLFGTGGDTELSVDAKKMLTRPESYDVIPMDWDLLENKYVKNKEWVSWSREAFGMFIPNQMGRGEHAQKTETNLADFLGVKGKYLKQIKINVTDWENNLARRQAIAKDLENTDRYDDFIMFNPVTTDDCFLSAQKNPFAPCLLAAHKHKNSLEASGDIGRQVELLRGNEGKIFANDTDKKMVKDFPFKGGNYTAPVVVYQEHPEIGVFNDLYVSGLDHYKHDKASTDSLGVVYVIRRAAGGIDEFSGRIVASYASRPNTIKEFNETCHVMLDAYGSVVLQENADLSFQHYLQENNLASYYLAVGEKFAQQFINAKASQNNKYGLNPSKANKDYLMKLVVQYCNEDIVIGVNDDGVEIRTKGVVRIPDIMLLEEIMNFKYGLNVDRITAFGHALAWDKYLTRLNIYPEEPEQLEEYAYFNTRMKRERVMTPLSRTSIRQKISPYSSRMTGHSLFD